METVHVTGNTVVDAVNWVRPQIESGASTEVKGLVKDLPPKSKLLLVTTHRRRVLWGRYREHLPSVTPYRRHV